ncbi:CLUMA_CG002554, isoform A [Clunio marinus]|uniref:CLUMA_CG002554, isoform A n=1 Tax=Clunio marinus TaxID=568069 RepID=A0A1J1HLC2_9DIPT|nr:CLUMA_CG002554, isoform A [Clunio marinus]
MSFVTISKIIFIVLLISNFTSCQDVSVRVQQGTLVGLKIFPEASRIPIYTYLGVPYAEPTFGANRFVAPKSPEIWNRTYYARDYKPVCPQLETSDDSSESRYRKSSEDCLYLNIWVPETAMKIGGFPIVIVITGQESSDWSMNRISGLDLAAEGVIVITIQYRTNVFGWLSLDNDLSPGNLGLMDQIMAFEWIIENVHKFGGDMRNVTLLGHGPMGVYNSFYHLLSPKTKRLFSRAVLMSGSMFAPYPLNHDASEDFVRLLTCDSIDEKMILKCLQTKSLEELLKAYESIIRNENRSNRFFGPTVDSFVNDIDARMFLNEPFRLITEYNYTIDVPILMGITSNEGAFVDEFLMNYGKQGYRKFKSFIELNILPTLLKKSHFDGFNKRQIRDAINWHYFQQVPKTTSHLLNSLIKITTEISYELPLFKTIELLTAPFDLQKDQIVFSDQNISMKRQKNENKSVTSGKLLDFSVVEQQRSVNNNIYVYVFHHSNAMDMRGNINYFGGAQHSSDLPFLFGPSLFKQISRRRLSQTEEKLCKKFKQLFGDFIKTGNPTPDRLFDSWHPYNANTKYIKIMGTKIDNLLHNRILKDSSFDENRDKIEDMLSADTEEKIQVVSNHQFNPYDLSNVNHGYEEPNRMSRQFDSVVSNVAKNTDYYFYLRRIYSFWYEYLPSLYKNYQDRTGRSSSEQDRYLENATPKYKHAFFSMLTLVCLLLAILGVCVYILKKNNKSLSSTASIL